MHMRLTNYLASKSTLTNSQYGFRTGYSTFMALLEMHSKITEAIDNNLFSIGIVFDLSKAFDTVDHKILIKNLSTMVSEGWDFHGSLTIFKIESNMSHSITTSQNN